MLLIENRDASNLLADLAHLGVRIEVRGDRLRFAPSDRVGPALLDRLRRHKADLMKALAPRQRAAQAIRVARRGGQRDLAVDLRDRWRERIAICMADGGLALGEAEQIAADEVENIDIRQFGDTRNA